EIHHWAKAPRFLSKARPKSTFIVPQKNAIAIFSYIKARNGKLSSWEIIIPNRYFKNSGQRAVRHVQKETKVVQK
ncbi:MAG: hypothetical protein QME12_07595, partial [Nanoarchaeota archaeon]|nr:hypothetical protein [Nanoarchaeota archaeon]